MSVWKDEKNGLWTSKIRYTDHTGKRIQKKKTGFALKRDAEQWEKEFLLQATGSSSMLFSSLCTLYLSDKKAHTKAITYNTKKNRIENWLLPYFGDMPINTIDAAAIRTWQTEIKTATGGTGKQLSPGYLQNIYTELSSIFNFAVRFYGLHVNPARVAGNLIGKKQKSLQFWTYDQFRAFMQTFDTSDQYYTPFMLLYFTGMRKGELFALTPADIDLGSGLISITKTYKMIDGKPTVTTPKTEKSTRTIHIQPFLCDLIRSYESHIYGLRADHRLFPYGSTTLAVQLEKHADMAGVPRIRVHDLRHSHASHLIELGFSALLVSERLGHESVSTTLNIYSHLFPSKQSEVAERLESFSTDFGTDLVHLEIKKSPKTLKIKDSRRFQSR